MVEFVLEDGVKFLQDNTCIAAQKRNMPIISIEELRKNIWS